MAFESQKKITLCCSGIQGGKTTVGTLWALKNSFGWGEDNCGIIGAPTYKILNQSTLPTWLKFASRFGTYNKSDQEFLFADGFKVYIRTSTDPDSIEGIRNCRWVWLDEAGKCKRQFYLNAEGRAARTNAPLMFTTTPYGLNWVYAHLIKPFKEGLRDDVGYYEWLSIENPSFPVEEYERQRRILDPRTFKMKYMGIHERMKGLVYELSPENLADPIKLPPNTKFYAGVDWGYAEGHEFGLVVRAITLDGFRYDIDEFKGSGLDPTQQIAMCQSKKSIYNIEAFYCDPARPDMIAMLNNAKCPAVGFHVGHESYKQIVPGINKHIELIRSGKYKIFRERCPNLEDEYETYHWPEFEENEIPKELPVATNDHLMDAARYVTIGTMDVRVKELPRAFLTQRHPHQDFWKPSTKSKQSKNWDAM